MNRVYYNSGDVNFDCGETNVQRRMFEDETKDKRRRQQFSKMEQKSTMVAPTGKRPTTKAEAMDGFSFGFLTRLPKFRPQIQF